jgi:hypothetical protein
VSEYSQEAATVVAGLVDDMLGDQQVVVSQGELAAEEAAARGFVAPQTRTRAGSGGVSASVLANEVRDLALPAREFPNWAENHVAERDHVTIETRARSMFAPVGSPEARERRLLRDPAAPVQAASAAPAAKPSGQSADAFVEGLSDAQIEALEASLLDRRAAEWQQTDEDEPAEIDATPAYELPFDDAWLTDPDEGVEQGEAA